MSAARSNPASCPRVVERVNADLDGRLALIAAPAGRVKATPVGGWHYALGGAFAPTAGLGGAHGHQPGVGGATPSSVVAGLSLNEGDNDLPRLLAHIVAAPRRSGLKSPAWTRQVDWT